MRSECKSFKVEGIEERGEVVIMIGDRYKMYLHIPAGIPELFSAAWCCISFFLPLYSYSLLSTAPYMADLNLKTVFILHSNKNSVKIFLGENNFWYVLIKALYLYFLL